jgi:hypothetical protein
MSEQMFNIESQLPCTMKINRSLSGWLGEVGEIILESRRRRCKRAILPSLQLQNLRNLSQNVQSFFWQLETRNWQLNGD